jgi:hypothetical protein
MGVLSLPGNLLLGLKAGRVKGAFCVKCIGQGYFYSLLIFGVDFGALGWVEDQISLFRDI